MISAIIFLTTELGKDGELGAAMSQIPGVKFAQSMLNNPHDLAVFTEAKSMGKIAGLIEKIRATKGLRDIQVMFCGSRAWINGKIQEG